MFRVIASVVAMGTGLSVASVALPASACQQIENYWSRKCIGVTAGVMQSNQPIIQWDCGTSQTTPDQFWSFSAGGFTEIQNCKDTRYCLYDNGDADGAQLVIGLCHPADDHGNIPGPAGWFVDQFSAGGDNAWVLQTEFGEDVAAVSLGAGTGNPPGTADGTGIIQWPNEISGAFSHTEQQWLFL